MEMPYFKLFPSLSRIPAMNSWETSDGCNGRRRDNEPRDAWGRGFRNRPARFRNRGSKRNKAVHLLQIWLFPDIRGHTPGYRQKLFTDAGKSGKWALVASPEGEAGSLVIHQDARVYQTKLASGQSVRHELKAGRAAFVHVATGSATVNGTKLVAGDAVAVEDEAEVVASGDGEVLLFDLA